MIAAWLVSLLAVIPPALADRGGGLTPAGVLDQLASNVEAIDSIEFDFQRTVVYRSRPSGTEFSTGLRTHVRYDRRADRIRVEYIAPFQGVRTFDDLDEEAARPATKAALTGIPLWTLDPKIQARGAQLSLVPSPPVGHAVLIGRPGGRRLPAFVPHWEALVSLADSRLVSVTHFADSGEPHIVIGFEDYMPFSGGKAVLPVVFRAVEYARRNTLTMEIRLTEVTVATRGAGGGR